MKLLTQREIELHGAEEKLRIEEEVVGKMAAQAREETRGIVLDALRKLAQINGAPRIVLGDEQPAVTGSEQAISEEAMAGAREGNVSEQAVSEEATGSAQEGNVSEQAAGSREETGSAATEATPQEAAVAAGDTGSEADATPGADRGAETPVD